MATGGTTNNMPIVGDVGRLRPTLDAIQKWLKARLDAVAASAVQPGSNALTGFQGQMRAYSVPRIMENPTYQPNNTRGQWLINFGLVQVAFNSNGDGTITYPTAFPSATSMAIAQTFAGSSNLDIVTFSLSPYAATGFNIRKNQASALTLWINYFAIGY